MTSTNAPELAPSLRSGRETGAHGWMRRMSALLVNLAVVGVGLEFAGITVLSLVPGADRPHALPFALGAGGFELMQSFVPDRGPRLIDSLASLTGLCVGLAAGSAGMAVIFAAARRRGITIRR